MANGILQILIKDAVSPDVWRTSVKCGDMFGGTARLTTRLEAGRSTLGLTMIRFGWLGLSTSMKITLALSVDNYLRMGANKR